MNSNNDVWSTLNEILTKAENEFGLSEVFQKYSISKDEPVTVEVRCGSELLCSQTRFFDSSNACCKWGEVMEQGKENPEVQHSSRDVKPGNGQEIAEVMNQALLLPSLKNVLLERSVSISEENSVTVNFRLADVGLFSLACPCPDRRRPCCQI